MTLSCPLDCEYLIEARQHERAVQLDPATVPNRDIEITEAFLERNDPLIIMLSVSTLRAAFSVPNAVDSDIREALEAIIKTYRTRQSGLIYESRPNNPIAAHIQQGIQQQLEDFQKRLQEQTGMSTLRDSDVLGVLVFLQRFELQWSNGRPRGRSFLSWLLNQFGQPATEQAAPAPAIVQP